MRTTKINRNLRKLFQHTLLSPAVIPVPRLGAKFNVMVWLQLATKAPRSRPSPRRGAQENGKETGRNWWVGLRSV